MKKAVIFVALAMALTGYCAAQSAGNDSQRIVGTWISTLNDGINTGTVTFVFNANGTCSSEGENVKYFVSSGKIIFSDNTIFDYYLSPDGKVLFLIQDGRGYWFDKK